MIRKTKIETKHLDCVTWNQVGDFLTGLLILGTVIFILGSSIYGGYLIGMKKGYNSGYDAGETEGRLKQENINTYDLGIAKAESFNIGYDTCKSEKVSKNKKTSMATPNCEWDIRHNFSVCTLGKTIK